MKRLLKKQEKDKKYIRKEVKKMKRILTLIMALALVGLILNIVYADDYVPREPGNDPLIENSVVTEYDTEIWVYTTYNAYNVATYSVNVTTTTITTSDGEGGTSTTIETTTVESTWHGGGLKTDTVHVTSTTTNSDGTSSSSDYTDSYVYSAAGVLLSVSGSGTYTSVNDQGHTYSGTITRTFIVKDGQALLTSSVTSGDITNKDSEHIGTFTNTTTIAESDYEYLGGSWVLMVQTSTSATSWDNGSSQVVTRTTTYTRDSQGVIIGISQTASGTYVIVTGKTEAGEVAQITYELQEYSATSSFDSTMGWYISSEEYKWVMIEQVVNPVPESNPEPPDPSYSVDPIIYGEVVGTTTINGVNYVLISAEYVDILDGQGLQEADGELFLVECSEEELAILMVSIGQKVMLMGDIAGGADGYVAIFDINPEYGGGMITDIPQSADAESLEALYQGGAWYQENLEAMAKIWQGLQINWITGIQYLIDLSI